ncbi:MAG TPA: helix-turn-helix transcriptional regulator [Mycobacterium sp.]|nr:helix-turn-helix transcriptional regulator [Mycobacterium sp.]
MRSAMSLSEVAGRGARSIRRNAGATLEEVARAARHYGLKWPASKVNDFESGRVSPSLPTLYAVTAALADATEQEVMIADLFTMKGRVAINERLTVDVSKVAAALSGASVAATVSELTGERERLAAAAAELKARQESWPPAFRRIKSGVYRAVYPKLSDSDLRVARSLGVDRSTAAAAMAATWGKTFVARRDELAGPDANAQKRGRISRELKAQLQEAIGGHDR